MRKLILTALCLSNLPATAAGQLEIEIRGGMAVGSHSTTLAGLDVLPRPSAELVVKKSLGSYSVLAGGSFASFGCENGFCEGPSIVGVRHVSAVAGAEISYGLAWLRGGGGLGFTQIRETSEIGPSLFAASGIRVDVWRFVVLPGVSYRWMRSGGKETLVAGADIGIGYRIGRLP